jgi:hypothetical protein
MAAGVDSLRAGATAAAYHHKLMNFGKWRKNARHNFRETS